MNRYPRETKELFAFDIKGSDGVVLTDFSAVTVAVVRDGTRPDPAAFVPPTVIGTQVGTMIDGLEPGNWRVFVKITGNPESPVMDDLAFTVE